MTDRKMLTDLFASHGCEAVGGIPFGLISDRLLPCRAKSRLPANAQSVLLTLFPYAFPGERPAKLSRYACVPDYHVAAGAVLRQIADELTDRFPGFAFEPFLDNSPVPEVYAAACAGLGVIGDNGLLIHPTYGSFVFIGEIVTDAEIPFSACVPAACLHCGQCGRACPAHSVGRDKADCLSAVSQQKKPFSPAQEQLLLNSSVVWGCDICQEACPLNRQAVRAPHPCFNWYRTEILPDDLLHLEDKAYGWRGAKVIRRNLELYTRLPIEEDPL